MIGELSLNVFGVGKRGVQKTLGKKLTRDFVVIKFSARQHGDGMKSPAAGSLEAGGNAAGVGHPGELRKERR